jgi:hypothetical protein
MGSLGTKEPDQDSKSSGKNGYPQTIDNGSLIREFCECRYIIFDRKKNVRISFGSETAEDHHNQRKNFVKKNNNQKR